MRKIDEQSRRRIKAYLENHIANVNNPRNFGKVLKGAYAEFWRYRVGQYRILCQIDDSSLIVLVIRVGHRSAVYKK